MSIYFLPEAIINQWLARSGKCGLMKFYRHQFME